MGRIAAVLLLAGGLMACSSTDRVAAYLDEVERITQRLTDESAIALPPGTTPTREGVAGVVAARRHALTDLASLDPPAEMAAEHLALVTVVGDLVTAAEAFLTETASLSRTEFLEALSASAQIDVLAARVAEACDVMRVRARTLGHVVSLEC
ncbi:MAG TPA: hypothetical protein VK960_03395 [Acidimicrobiia bacterium]|nr:hypothetical protein [Acidimicrobiia bacterium]